MKLRLTIPVLLAVAACEEESGIAILPPDDVELHWDAAFNAEEDGLVGVVTVDVMVYEALTGAPLEGVPVVLDAELASLLRPEGVLPADEWCALDETSALCDGLVWDAWRDQYLAIDGLDDGPVTLWTDADGLGRATVYVDAFPIRAGSFGPDAFGPDAFGPVDVSVEVAGSDARAVFSLVPQ